MQTGKLRHRITIQKPVEQQDAAGQVRIVDWTNLASRISAEVMPDRAGEFFEARQVQATTNALIRLRYRPGITTEDGNPDGTKIRVVHHLKDGPPAVVEYWNVEGVVHFQSRFRELRLMCLKREEDGWRA
jgi:SPP1 family predicted phage head-tail adaptor